MNPPIRITVVGAGSVGGVLAFRLARAGHVVSVIARGDHLGAIQARGLTLIEGSDRPNPNPRPDTIAMQASDDPAVLARSSGPSDLIIIALKAHSIPQMLPRLSPLLQDQTRVVAAINGVPWWYFNGHGGRHAGRPLQTLDPDGRAALAIDPSRLVGCIVHLSAEVPAPGVVRHTAGKRLILGEVLDPETDGGKASGHDSGRQLRRLGAADIAVLCGAAGFTAEHTQDIRREVWTKLIGNLSFNPVSALTGLRMDGLCADPLVCDLLRTLIDEGKAVASAMGVAVAIDADARIAMARSLGPVRTSTLQDFEAGRPPELDALVGAVIELAQWYQVPVPALRQVHALAQAKARALGLYGAQGVA